MCTHTPRGKTQSPIQTSELNRENFLVDLLIFSTGEKIISAKVFRED